MIDKEQLETYQLAMFPLMLQALYNAKITLHANGEQRRQLDNGDAKGKTLADIDVVIDSFKSIGVKRRFGKEQNLDGTGYSLRHFSDNEADSVVLLFNPDAMERDQEIDEMKAKWKAHSESIESALGRKDEQIRQLRKTISERDGKIKELEYLLQAWNLFPKTAERLNGLLSYGLTADEMRAEIKDILASHNPNIN